MRMVITTKLGLVLSRPRSCFNCLRHCSTASKKSKKANIFDRGLKRRQRELSSKLEDFHVYQYVKEEFGFRLSDRVWDIKRQFTNAIELSSGTGFVAQHLTNEVVENILLCDTTSSNLERVKLPEGIHWSKILVDDEQLPFKDDCADIFLSNLSLHWVNRLPELFREVRRCLRGDGVFLGALFGGQTLFELRCSLQLAETDRLGGFTPHISPFVEPADIGALLNRSGFTLLTIDVEEMKVSYPSMFELIFDLQSMGESNAAWNRRLHLNRDAMIAAAAIYRELYSNEDGNVPATFQVVNFIGWKPDPSQPQPAARGSANVSFKEIENLDGMIENLKQNSSK